MSRAFTPAEVKGLIGRIGERMRERQIAIAAQARADVEVRQGVLPTLTVVDGRRGASLSEVKVGGHIQFRFDVAQRAAMEARDVAIQISPEDTSPDADARVFKDSFLFMVDGAEADLRQSPPGAIITLINRRFGYSKRLERGWSLQAPTGVMEVTAKLIRPRWGRAVDIRYTWADVEGAASDSDRDEARGRYPVITFQSRGFQ